MGADATEARRPQGLTLDPQELGAREIASLVRTNALSPVDVVRRSLERIERVTPALNPIAWVREAALEDARAAERRLSHEPARALEGVPFTVKDVCPLADGPTSHGSRAMRDTRYGVDAEVVRLLKRAGAILVATTTTPELGARGTTESELFGITRNPWDPQRTPGGSSGGAAVCAATGIAPINVGSDGGGSVRVPAACCGVVGLKPARGRVSTGPLRAQEWGGLNIYGPITRRVADAALFLDIATGPAPADPTTAVGPAHGALEASHGRARRRIAFITERGDDTVDPACVAAVERLAARLEQLGHEVTASGPPLAPFDEAFAVVSSIGIASTLPPGVDLELLEPRTRRIVEYARGVSGMTYDEALRAMHSAARAVAGFFDRHDALLTPTVPRPTPRLEQRPQGWEETRRWLSLTLPFNCTGQPAISVPAGLSPEGLPLAVQLVGAAGRDDVVLALAAELEEAAPWPPPPGW